MNTYTHPPHGHAYTNRNAHTRKHAHTLHTSPLIDGFSISLLATGLGTDTECCYKIRSEITYRIKTKQLFHQLLGNRGARERARLPRSDRRHFSMWTLPPIHPSSLLGTRQQKPHAYRRVGKSRIQLAQPRQLPIRALHEPQAEEKLCIFTPNHSKF